MEEVVVLPQQQQQQPPSSSSSQETKSALWRREEQLRRWAISETNSAASTTKNPAAVRVRFHDGCVFLAACSSGDRDEVSALLLRPTPTTADDDEGPPPTDINTANVDGLTALHQACIDENLSMVKFLVEHGACVNLYDNEGWTALHATASCGFVNIAKYLIEKGATLEAVNNDGELALDLAEGNEMEKLISEAMEKQGIDAEQARKEEEEMMLRDANQWLNSKTFQDVPHPKTGATALHIAAAKGYIKVLKILIEAGADVNAKDFDGWTPLHAAAHWAQEEACKILVENFCNFEAKNNSGQTAIDVVDSDIEPVLEELKKKQEELIEQHKQINTRSDDCIRGVAPGKRRSSITRLSVDQKASLPLKNVEEERAQMDALRQPVAEEKDEERKDSEDSTKEESEEADESETETEKRNEINRQASQPWAQINGSSHKISDLSSEVKDSKVTAEEEIVDPPSKAPSVPPSTSRSQNLGDASGLQSDSAMLRKKQESNYGQSQASSANISKEAETKETKDKSVSETTKATGIVPPYVKPPVSRVTSAPVTSTALAARLATTARQDSGIESKPTVLTNSRLDGIPSQWRASLRKTGTASDGRHGDRESDKIHRSVSIPRTASNRNSDDPVTQKRSLMGSAEETDQKNRFNELYNRYAALVAPNGSARGTTTAGPSASSSGQSSAPSVRRQAGVGRKEVEGEPGAGTGFQSGASLDRLKNLETAETLSGAHRRSSDVFKRDDEKEVERKARAKKARESRRSTQGVSKEDLQKAEEALQAANAQRIVAEVAPEKSTGSKGSSDELPTMARRPLQDLDSSTSSGSSSRSSRNSLILSSGAASASQPSLAVAPSVSTSTVPSDRTQYRSKCLQEKEAEEEARLATEDEDSSEASKAVAPETTEDKKEEKEDPSQKSAAIRAKKKRDSRRSTGRITLDGLQGSETPDDNKEQQEEKNQKSSAAPSEVTPAACSTGGVQPVSSSTSSYTRYASSTATRDVDYKKMYEEEHAVNEKLKKEAKELQQDLADSKAELERVKGATVPPSSVPERRMTFTEKRALERKISELEEELKNSETAKTELKSDNQRLKDENGALIRVISKLSK